MNCQSRSVSVSYTHLDVYKRQVYGLSHDGGKSWTAFQSIPKEKLWDDDEKRVAIPIGGQIAMSSANPLNFVWAPTWGTFDGIQGSPAFAPWPHVTFDGGKTWLLCRLTRPHTVPCLLYTSGRNHAFGENTAPLIRKYRGNFRSAEVNSGESP